MGGNAAEGLSLVAYPRHDDRDLRPASVWNAGITSSPKRRIETRFCSWLMSPKPVWHNRCCTPASRNLATWSTHPRRRAVERPGGEHVFDRLVVADHGIGPGVQHRRVDGELGRVVRGADMHHVGAGLQQQ